MRVALSEVLGGLSFALDITEGEPPGHAVRTTAIGMRLGEALRLGEDERSALFYALLLKDAGCSSNASRLASLFATDDRRAKHALRRTDWTLPGRLAAYAWRTAAPGGGLAAKARRLRRIAGEEEVTRELIGTRCERGAQIARMLELPEASAQAIAAADEHWDGGGHPLGLRGEAIPLAARIVALAQAMEVSLRAGGVRAAYRVARRRRGRWFDPALVDALARLRDDARFWGPLEDPRAVPAPGPWEPAERVLVADQDGLDRVAEAFARVIDAKSPYTARHSEGVAHHALAIAGAMGLPADGLRDLRRAALLHDVGKLAVSSRVLDKPGRLDPAELEQIRRHPRYTQLILERVACLRPIVAVAASHHERLDGSGYHRGLTGVELSRPARVLAVADVFEALTADRPYRAAMDVGEALEIVRRDRGSGLDPAAVDALEALAGGAGPGWTARLGSSIPGDEGERPAVRGPARARRR